MHESITPFRTSADVVAREIPEGLMLVNVQTGAAFKLNQVGAEIWKRLDGATDVATLVAHLEQRYRIGTVALQRDVDTLLADLEKQGLVGRSHQP